MRVHASTLLLVFLPFLGSGSPRPEAFFLLGLFFVTLLLHEAGHALFARVRGLEVSEIVLLPIGGYTQARIETGDWKSELVVVVGGPAVNLALAALCFLLLGDARASGGAFDPARFAPGPDLFTREGFLARAFQANAVLGLLNLCPVWPMDGGRILRAALVPAAGLARATRISASVARAVAIGVIAFSTREPAWMLPASIFGIFCWRQADREERRVRFLEAHRRVLATRPPLAERLEPGVPS